MEEGSRVSSTLVSVVFRQLLECFPSDQLDSAIRRIPSRIDKSFICSDQMFEQSISSMRCRWLICIACGLMLLLILCALVVATVSGSFPLLRCFDEMVFGELRKTERSNVSPSAHLMSDGSGSHCITMPESPRQLDIFTPDITANVSVLPFVLTLVEVPYSFDFTYILNTCQYIESCNILQHKVTSLNSRKLAVFGDSLDSSVWLCLCFAFDA